jgi:hypothetical protein
MTSSACLPSSFETFQKKKKLIKNVKVKGMLNRFSYRYRLAKSFKGIDAPEVGKTLSGYSAILKLFLVYTAYEEIAKAGFLLKVSGVSKLSVHSYQCKEIADRIRSSKKLHTYLLSYDGYSDGLETFVDLVLQGRTNDIICIAYALRNIFAHGDLTPSVIGVTTKAQRKLLEDLANELLNYCDKLFTDCLLYA